MVEDGWRYFSACDLDRNVHWWRYDFEALAFPALASLGPRARHVLVLGGISGGVASALLQSRDLERVVWVTRSKSLAKAARRCVPYVAGLGQEQRLEVQYSTSWELPKGSFDIIIQDTLAMHLEEGREVWEVSSPYFAPARLKAFRRSLSPTGLLVASAGYLGTPGALQDAFKSLSVFDERWTFQFATPDMANAHGVTVGFISGGNESTVKMNSSWWRLQDIETCLYTEEMHEALLTPSLSVSQVLSAELTSLRTCIYEESRTLAVRSTDFQEVRVSQDGACRSLYLDNELQLTDFYGDFYHEALVHVALASQGASARRVLVLGAGDGGVANVILKYPEVQVLQVEIDEAVIETSKQFFPNYAAAFSNPRYQLIVADAVRWVSAHSRQMQGSFDLCIIDSTDSPLVSSWSVVFYQELKLMLKATGAIVQNLGSQSDLLADFRNLHLPVFPKRFLINCLTPDYESPYFLAILSDTDLRPVNWTWWESLGISSIYYHPPLHAALLAVPRETLDLYIHGKEWTPHDASWSNDFFSGEL